MLMYMLIAGIICFIEVHYKYNFGSNSENKHDDLHDISWTTGISQDWLLLIIYSLSLLLGWILLPLSILDDIIEKITGESFLRPPKD